MEKFEITPIGLKADMHNHTKGSDGKQRSLRFLLRAAGKGKNIVAMTDHDSIKGFENLENDLYTVVETIRADKSYDPQKMIDILEQVKLLTGTELITTYNGIVIEVLGYNFDIGKMKEEIQRLKTTVQKKSYETLYEGFSKIIEKGDIVFDREKLDEAYEKIKVEGKGGVVGPFFQELSSHEENKELLKYEENGEEKIADTLKLFINKHLYNMKSPFFVNMEKSRPKYQDTIDAIHNSGGKAILAHPGRYMDKFNVLEYIDNMISYGLDGIEVFYPDHDYEFRKKLLEKVREHKLIASGGSDDHHTKKEGTQYEMGRVDIPDIPETQWMKESSKNYLDKNNILNKYLEELKSIKQEREKGEER